MAVSSPVSVGLKLGLRAILSHKKTISPQNIANTAAVKPGAGWTVFCPPVNVFEAVLLATGLLVMLDDWKIDGPTALEPIMNPEVTAREVTVADADDTVGAGDGGDGEDSVADAAA